MQEPEPSPIKQSFHAEIPAAARTGDFQAAAPKAAPAPSSEQLSLGTKLLYGAPNLAAGAMAIPILINMPKFYADVVAVPLAYLAIAIAATRCLDAIIDPSIGLISDRTRTRWGRRRPYIFAGAPLGGLAFWALMSPPSYLTGVGGVVWFIATSMLCSFFLTIALLPHSALGAELSLDYQERNSLFGAREGFGVLGTIIAAAAPGFLMQRFGWGERMAFSRLGLVFMIGLVATCWLMVALVYERPEFSRQPPNPLVPGVRRALRNRPFRVLLASYIAYTIGAGVGPILLPFFISYVVQPGHPALWLSIILLVYLGIGFMFIPVGVVAARRWGKLPTLTICYLIGIGVGLLTFLLVGKGDTGRLMLLVAIGAIAFGMSGFLPPSMQAEVIDYDEFHTGRRREAQYAGFWSILPKLAAIPSAALPIALLASLGYVSNAVQKPEVIHAIRILYCLGPAVAAVASLAIVSRFPINAENHAIILDGIERHKRGEQALDPLTGRELPPPEAGNTDEASEWFLDNFSQRELERFIACGSRSAMSDVWRAAALSLAACLIAAWVALYRIGSAGDPGAIASLGVVVSGFALTLFLFHLLRIGPARRLTAGAIPKAVVHAHLENCKQGYI